MRPARDQIVQAHIMASLRIFEAIFPTVSVANLKQPIPLAPHLAIWQDIARTATPASLPDATDPAWHRNTESKINFGNSSAAFWVRFTLSDLDQLDQTTYLRLDYPHLDKAAV